MASPPTTTLVVDWNGNGTASGSVTTPVSNTGFIANGVGVGAFNVSQGRGLSSGISATDYYGTVVYGITNKDVTVSDSIANWDEGNAAVSAYNSTVFGGVNGSNALTANSNNFSLISQAIVDPSGTNGAVFVNASVAGTGIASVIASFTAKDETCLFNRDSIYTTATVSGTGSYLDANVAGSTNGNIQVIGNYVGSGSTSIYYNGYLATP